MTLTSLMRAVLVSACLAAPMLAAPAQAQMNAAGERACRQNAMPACGELNEVVAFGLRTGRQGANPGDPDPIWTVNGTTAFVVTHPSWAANGAASWISPNTVGTDNAPGGDFSYTAHVWFDQDPYLYDFVRLNLTIGGDNTVVGVAVNGTAVHTGNGGNVDFQAGNFDQFVHSDPANHPWVRGCNEITVTVRNSSGPSGVSVLGGVRARCSRCLTERPPMGTPAAEPRE